MTILALAPRYNTGTKRDATGAFQPEARAFAALHNGDVVLVDNKNLTSAGMRSDVLTAIRDHRPSHIAFFCHGWKTGIQFGFGMKHLDELAEAIRGCYQGTCSIVTLYACSTGGGPGTGGDGGFADGLRDALCRQGDVDCFVDAHDRPGHTTRNPYVRRFEGMGSAVGGSGGYWIVSPGSTLWRPWVRALRDTDLRFRFPTMDVEQIHAELAAGGA